MSRIDEGNKAPMTIEEFDRRFDEGEDMGRYVDWSKPRRLTRSDRDLQLSLPAWMFEGLHEEAARRGVSAEALLKMWLADRLDAAQVAQSRFGNAAE